MTPDVDCGDETRDDDVLTIYLPDSLGGALGLAAIHAHQMKLTVEEFLSLACEWYQEIREDLLRKEREQGVT